VSFSARIAELCGENVTLKQELKQRRDQAAAESELREQFEQELKELTIANQILQQDLQKSAIVVDCFRSDIYRYIHIVNGVMPLMDELRAGLTLNEGSDELELLLCPAAQSHT
jgi:IS30 family transposase